MTQAVFLVGGKGTRLHSLTQDMIPKPMINVHGRPFLLHLVKLFKRQGIKQFVFCTAHLGNVIKDFFGDGKKFGITIKYSEEKKPLGSGGAIKNVEGLLEENFLLINGDDFFPIDFNAFFKFHKENKAIITLALRQIGTPNEFHTVYLNKGNIIKEYFGKEYTQKSNFNFSGYFAINKKILSLIPKNKFVSIEFDVLPNVIKEKKVYGFVSEGALFDIGSPEGYNKFKDWASENLV